MGERIQLRRTKGWRMPANTVVVSRPSRWGNPWRVVQSGRFTADGCTAWAGRHDWELNYPLFREKHDAAERATSEFRRALVEGQLHRFSLADVPMLRGKNLACWCKPGTPCHADVLLELANA